MLLQLRTLHKTVLFITYVKFISTKFCLRFIW